MLPANILLLPPWHAACLSADSQRDTLVCGKAAPLYRNNTLALRKWRREGGHPTDIEEVREWRLKCPLQERKDLTAAGSRGRMIISKNISKLQRKGKRNDE